MNFVDIYKYLIMIYRRRYLFMMVSAVVMTAITLWSYSLQEKYQADSTVFIEKNVINELVKGIAVTPNMEERIRVLRYAMLSRDLISKVLVSLDEDAKAKDNKEIQKLISDLQKRTNLQIKGNDLFTVSITDPDPVFAQNFINTLVSSYVKENISGKREETYGANRFLDEQQFHFKNKLDDLDNQIIKFRQEKGIFSTVNDATILSVIKNDEEEIVRIKIQKNETLATLETIAAQLQMLRQFSAKTYDRFLPVTALGLRAQLETKIENLLLNYNEQHPEVIRTRILLEAATAAEEATIAAAVAEMEPIALDPAATAEPQIFNPLEDPIYVDLKMRLNAKESELKALEARERDLTRAVEINKNKLKELPEEQKILSDLEREKNTYQALYENLLQRQGMSEVSKQMEVGDKTTTFRIVDPAIFPRKPVSPNRVLMILLAFIFGIAAGAGLVIVLELASTSVRDTGQLQNLGLEILATIPSMREEVQINKSRSKDVLAYSAGGVYFLGVVGLLAYEILQQMS